VREAGVRVRRSQDVVADDAEVVWGSQHDILGHQLRTWGREGCEGY
jgi:hypothetical protein